MKDNNLYYVNKGKEKEVVPVFENEVIIKGKLKDKFLFLIKNEENKNKSIQKIFLILHKQKKS